MIGSSTQPFDATEAAKFEQVVRAAAEVLGTPFVEIGAHAQSGGMETNVAFEGLIQQPARSNDVAAIGLLERAVALIGEAQPIIAAMALPAPQRQPPAAFVGPTVTGRAVELEVSVEGAYAVIAQTKRLYADAVDRELDRVQHLLSQFRGIPSVPNFFEVVGVESQESVFQRVLRWLLMPSENHGLGSKFLRRFLARVGVDWDRHRRVDGRAPAVSAHLEFSWTMPASTQFRPVKATDGELAVGQDAALFAENGRRALRVDILLVLPRILIPIEVKVEASEAEYEFLDRRWLQAAAYVTCLRRASQSFRTSAGDRQAHELRDRIGASLRQHAGSDAALGADQIIGVLVHHEGQCANKDSEVRKRPGEHGEDVRHISWLDICDILAKLDSETESSSLTRHMLRSFQSTVMWNGSRRNTLEALERLRLLSDERGLARKTAMQVHADISNLRAAVQKRDTCCITSRG